MIVASGATDGQPEHHLARRRDDVVQLVELGLFGIGRLIIPDAETVVSGGNDRIVRHLVQLVAGQLLAHELVVGLVVVQRADDVIAVLPGIWFHAVAL